ncbi:phenylalanine ammonium lyase [Exidia glandulosa HHB12029]|uniref:Phenylalanine ammonium lyase n=1 Tax=Exidia glandulosa HHB12029 TaxID=1314781 RepID=A0A165FGS9_EXIGL|nr:phenylalanine ammonium lyase [Exidia glandulosa HHB12029]
MSFTQQTILSSQMTLPSSPKNQLQVSIVTVADPDDNYTTMGAASTKRDALINGNGVAPRRGTQSVDASKSSLLSLFLDSENELEHFISHQLVLDGKSLSVPGIVATSRYASTIALSQSPEIQELVAASRKVIDDRLATATSIYGVSTGFGGSANTRTDKYDALGAALLQLEHSGVISTSSSHLSNGPLPHGDPQASTTMPTAWVRAAIAVRINSIIRGHSGVRWVVMEQMQELLNRKITPVVPLRGSISASGDLAPLAYVAGAVAKHPHVRVLMPSGDIKPASELDELSPLALKPKEQLGLTNGTAFSAAVAALAIHDAVHLAVLAQACTAFATEALLGTQASQDQFIHDECRPHPGQVESARVIHSLLEGSNLARTGREKEVTITQDSGQLRQDRYPLRTAAQYLGPQVEDIIAAHASITLECNSTTDNPLVDSSTGRIHQGGNFQAMAVTNAMEKTRLALFHIGKLMFAQATELLNPAFNRGLPPSVAATDPSTNYHAKGLDIAMAAYVSELGFLANPVGTHVQSAEMHNQAVNSLALVSARATMTAIDVLYMLFASYVYVLCQAVDLRVMHAEFEATIPATVRRLLVQHFNFVDAGTDSGNLPPTILDCILEAFEGSSTLDLRDRIDEAGRAAALPIYGALPAHAAQVPACIEELKATLFESYTKIRLDYLRGNKTASHMLGRTRRLYEFVRHDLSIEMHGLSNLEDFVGADGLGRRSVGDCVSAIYESMRDGQMQKALVEMFM